MPEHFTQVQQAFMAHIRDPQQHAKPSDIEERRMAIYRDLFLIMWMALSALRIQY